MRKPRGPVMVRPSATALALIDHGADRLLRLDVTDLSPQDAASAIADWLLDPPQGAVEQGNN